MEDIYNNYRMIEEVKERAVSRGSGMVEYEARDVVGKIEYNDGDERYENGFSDYHG